MGLEYPHALVELLRLDEAHELGPRHLGPRLLRREPGDPAALGREVADDRVLDRRRRGHGNTLAQLYQSDGALPQAAPEHLVEVRIACGHALLVWVRHMLHGVW